MFAAGRILRNNRRLSAVPPVGLLAPPRVREKERRKFRCYMPFMWSAMVMSCVGLVIILAGIAMCFFGYYFRPLAVVIISEDHSELFVGSNNWTSMLVPVVPTSTLSPSVTVTTETIVNYDQSSLQKYRGLIYAGPVVMSFGCFAIVFACVIVCETRDRALETMDDRVRQGLSELPAGGIRPDFYTLVVEHKLLRVEKQHRRRRLRHEEATNDVDDGQLQAQIIDRTSTNGCERSWNVDSNCQTADVAHATTPTINIFLHDDNENNEDNEDSSITTETTQVDRLGVGKLVGYFPGCDRQQVGQSPRVGQVNRISSSKSKNETVVESRLENGRQLGLTSDVAKWKSAPCVVPETGSTKLLPSASTRSSLLLDRFRYTASPPLTSLLRHVISGADGTFQTASFSKLDRHSKSSDFVEVTSHCSDNGIGQTASQKRRSPSSTASPSKNAVTSGPSSERSPTVVVHAASVHAASDCDNNHNENHGFKESTVGDDTKRVGSLLGHGGVSAAKQHNTSDDKANGCVSCEAPSGADTPHFRPLSIDACPTDNCFERPVCRAITDRKTSLEWPGTLAEDQPTVDENKCNGPSPRQQRMFATQPPVSVPDNVSNRFRRRRRVLDSSAAGSCHTVSGGGDFVDTCAISSVPDTRLPPSSLDRELKCSGHSGSVVAYEYTDTILSSCNDCNSVVASSSGAAVSSDIRSTSFNQLRRLHYSAPLTAAPRLYFTRMRMWRSKRCSATGTTLPKHRSNTISRPDNCESAVYSGSQSDDSSDNSSVVAAHGGQKGRAIRKHKYRFPTLTFSTPKTRLSTSRGRQRRPLAPVGGVLQVSS